MSFEKNADRVLRLGRLELRGAVARLRSRAMRAYQTGNPDDLRVDLFGNELARTVTRGTVVSHMLGYRSVLASRAIRRHRALRLSYDEILSVLRQQLELDVDELEARYETDVLRVVKGTTDRVELSLRNTLTELITDRVHVTEAREQFAEAVNSLGLATGEDALRRGQIDAIFNTQNAISYHAGQWNGYRSEVVDEILWGFKYVTVGDAHVRPDHVAMDATTLQKDDPFWAANWPPNGWNCRCVIVPIFEERDEVQPKEVVTPPDPDIPGDTEKRRPAVADPGFSLNPGKVYDTRITPKTSPHAKPGEATQTIPTAPPTPGPAPPTPSAPSAPPPVPPPVAVPREGRQHVINDVTTRRKPSPVQLSEADRKAVDAVVRESRARRSRSYFMTATAAALVGWSLAKRLERGTEVEIVDPQLATPEVRDVVPLLERDDMLVRVRTRAGDVALPIEDGRIIYPPGARYRIVDRRTLSRDGRRVVVLTLERIN